MGVSSYIPPSPLLHTPFLCLTQPTSNPQGVECIQQVGLSEAKVRSKYCPLKFLSACTVRLSFRLSWGLQRGAESQDNITIFCVVRSTVHCGQGQLFLVTFSLGMEPRVSALKGRVSLLLLMRRKGLEDWT